MDEDAGFDGALRLHDWGVIRAQGDEAARFLHGQLTQDVEHLDAAHARLAGYCSPKGRLLASFVVMRPGDTEIWLACSADLLHATLQRLRMFVLRTRCKLDDASATISVWGLAGPSAVAWLGDAAPAAVWSSCRVGEATVVLLPPAQGHARFLWLGPAAAPPPVLPPLSAKAWRWLEVNSAVPRIAAATADRFVPQMVNFELIGGVDFGKGCYPGQEVVARSHYRGTVKRRAVLFEGDAADVQPGDELFGATDAGQPVGQVVDAAQNLRGTWAILAEVRTAALGELDLHLGGADGPRVRRTALPYALPVESA